MDGWDKTRKRRPSWGLAGADGGIDVVESAVRRLEASRFVIGRSGRLGWFAFGALVYRACVSPCHVSRMRVTAG